MLSFIRFASKSTKSFRSNRSLQRLKKVRQDKTMNEFGPNPGLDNSINSIRNANIKLDEEIIQEVVDEDTINPYGFGRIYADHQKEEHVIHEKLVGAIVKNKYFPETKLPNLLTWSEKEHIRYLHEENPEEWTAEKIAESFPVTVGVAKKLLKVTWKPATSTRIERHDSSVIRNWKELKAGTLENVTRDLREKFLKFSNRIIPPRREDDLKKTIQLTNEQKVFGEFSSLVAPKIEDNVSTTITELEQKLSDENRSLTLATIEKYYLDKNKYTTLSEVKEKLSTALEKNKQLNPLDQLIVQSKSNDSIAFSEVPEPTEMKSVYAKPKNSSVFGDMNQLSEPEVEKVYFKRVRIPKSVYKKGCTYKINDCYYDHDGQFLYRVPGLTGQFQD